MTHRPICTLYGCPNTRSLRAAWALEEAGADYDYAKVDLMKGEGRSAQFLAINPGGKVPALLDDGQVITESGAILTHIGERHPASGLIPGLEFPQRRAAYFEWLFFVISELEQPLWTIAKHRFALPPDLRVPQIEATAVKEFQRAANVAQARLGERDFAVDGQFTAADILLAHTVAWAKSARVPFESTTLEAHFARCWARPAREHADARERAAT
jgi:glutathione S-transferase